MLEQLSLLLVLIHTQARNGYWTKKKLQYLFRLRNIFFISFDVKHYSFLTLFNVWAKQMFIDENFIVVFQLQTITSTRIFHLIDAAAQITLDIRSQIWNSFNATVQLYWRKFKISSLDMYRPKLFCLRVFGLVLIFGVLVLIVLNDKTGLKLFDQKIEVNSSLEREVGLLDDISNATVKPIDHRSIFFLLTQASANDVISLTTV